MVKIIPISGMAPGVSRVPSHLKKTTFIRSLAFQCFISEQRFLWWCNLVNFETSLIWSWLHRLVLLLYIRRHPFYQIYEDKLEIKGYSQWRTISRRSTKVVIRCWLVTGMYPPSVTRKLTKLSIISQIHFR